MHESLRRRDSHRSSKAPCTAVIRERRCRFVKAAPFDYVRAESLPHALALLDEHGFDAKLVAGGMSLVPMMAMRLARPALLIDIYRLEDLRTVQQADDVVLVGAAVRQFEVEHGPEL